MSAGLAGTLVIGATAIAQGQAAPFRLPGALAMRVGSHPLVTQIASPATEAAQTASAATYTYTLVSYPGTLNTLGVGINLNAAGTDEHSSALEIVGAYEFPDAPFPDGVTQTGFIASVFGHDAVVAGHDPVVEKYRPLNDPAAPKPQQAYSINDEGTVVGDYILGAIQGTDVFHSYILKDGAFTRLDVPFAGAQGTYSPAINDRGEIVGGWVDSAGNAHSYTLINGAFKSFDPPGSAQGQLYYGINNNGDVTGSFADAGGNIHGFLRQGDRYTQLDVPGAIGTFPSGINDAGTIVGGFCPTTACLTTGDGELGFLLSHGVYTSFAIPGEPEVGLASINDQGVIMGNYLDAAGLIYTFVAVKQ